MTKDSGHVGDADRALVNDAPMGHRPAGFDPSRDDGRKGYLLGKIDERKDIAHFLIVRSARALVNGHNLPWWAFVRRFQCRWTAISCSLAAADIEGGDYATDQALWLVNIDNGIIVGREGFKRDSDGNPQGGDGTAPSQRDDSAAPQGDRP